MDAQMAFETLSQYCSVVQPSKIRHDVKIHHSCSQQKIQVKVPEICRINERLQPTEDQRRGCRKGPSTTQEQADGEIWGLGGGGERERLDSTGGPAVGRWAVGVQSKSCMDVDRHVVHCYNAKCEMCRRMKDEELRLQTRPKLQKTVAPERPLSSPVHPEGWVTSGRRGGQWNEFCSERSKKRLDVRGLWAVNMFEHPFQGHVIHWGAGGPRSECNGCGHSGLKRHGKASDKRRLNIYHMILTSGQTHSVQHCTIALQSKVLGRGGGVILHSQRGREVVACKVRHKYPLPPLREQR